MWNGLYAATLISINAPCTNIDVNTLGMGWVGGSNASFDALVYTCTVSLDEYLNNVSVCAIPH